MNGLTFFTDRVRQYQHGTANYLFGDPLGHLIRRTTGRHIPRQRQPNAVTSQPRVEVMGRLHFYALPNSSSLSEDKYMCQVLDRFYEIFERVDQDLKVETTCGHDSCLCNAAIVAVINTANLKLTDFRKKLVESSQRDIFDRRARGWSGDSQDCSICYEKVEEFIQDRERHILQHAVCRNCFANSGRRLCPCCRHEMKFGREVNDFLTQMELIDKAISDNDEWIDYLSTNHGQNNEPTNTD